MAELSRRSFLAAAFGMCLGCAVSSRPAVAQFAAAGPGGRYSAVLVDVSPLYAKGLGAYADFVRSALSTELQRAFADRLGGAGPLHQLRR